MREIFGAGADHLVGLVEAIGVDQWDEPGLGDWSVRSLVGHTGRAMATVIDYLSPASPTPGDEPPAIEIVSARDYFVASMTTPDMAGLNREVHERGVQAGMALGSDPAGAIRVGRDRVVAALDGVDDPATRLVRTRFGVMALSDYLPTRVFELAVHGLDIARATGVDLELPRPVLEVALELTVAIAAARDSGPDALLALTGRGGWAPDRSVL